jgi:hypothetical protein
MLCRRGVNESVGAARWRAHRRVMARHVLRTLASLVRGQVRGCIMRADTSGAFKTKESNRGTILSMLLAC